MPRRNEACRTPMSEAQAHNNPRYRMAIRRPVTMVMLFVTLLVFGARSFNQLPVNLMPDISYPSLTVRTEYEGAAPEDVEKLVTRPLEELLGVVSGMVEISSISSAGLSDITLEFTWDTDMTEVQQEVRDRIDLFIPPRELTEKPVILRYDPTLDPVIRIAVAPKLKPEEDTPERRAQALRAIRDDAERNLKSDLEAVRGIAQAMVKGGEKEEIQVLADAVRLKSLGLSLDDLNRHLASQNINLSGGQLREGRAEYLVRTLNEFQTLDEIADSLIPTPQGQMRLRDLAQVYLGAQERETFVMIDGQEAVALDIYKEGSANTVEVCDKVKDLLNIPRELGLMEEVMRSAREAAMAQGGADEAGLDTGQRNLLDRLPRAIELHVIGDQSRFINAAVGEVQNALLIGGFLALLVLFMFLREVKPTLVVGLTIPVSVIATFIPMFIQDISLNIMSLGGLSLGIGMMLDCSIVVLESIFRCQEEGDGTVDAAERGTQEVHDAVISSTLTTVCVFLPLTFVEGIAGQVFNDLALTVTYSLMASMLAALYLVPLIASQQRVNLRAYGEAFWLVQAYRESRTRRGVLASVATLPWYGVRYSLTSAGQIFRETFGPAWASLRNRRRGLRGWFLALMILLLQPFLLLLAVFQVLLGVCASLIVTPLVILGAMAWFVFLAVRWVAWAICWIPLELFERAFNLFRATYVVVLRHSLRFSPIVLLISAGLAVHAGYIMRNLGAELMPELKQGEFGIRLETRAGTRIEETARSAERVAAILRDVPEIQSVSVEIGKEKSDASTERGENIALFTVLLRNPEENAKRQDQIVARLREAISGHPGEEVSFTLPSLFTFKTAVELQLSGDELPELERLGTLALERVKGVPGLTDLKLSVRPGYPEVIIEIDRQRLASMGLTPQQVASRIRAEVQGEVATRFTQAGEKVDIRVRTDRQMLQSVDGLRQLAVSGSEAPIPLAEVAKIRVQEGPSEIRRVDQREVVLVTGNVQGRNLGSVSREMMAAIADIQLPPGYFFAPGGQYRELDTSYASLNFALVLALFLVYVVMACQFESFWHPFLIMFTVPLAFIGVVYALLWTDTDLSIMVFLGAIILAGIVVDNAIVLVDYINQLRGRGLSKREAIILGGQVRLRPILMTAITTILGLVPMLFLSGEGTEMQRPMAITVVAGLSCATVLTLLIIPMAYDFLTARDKVQPAPPESAP